MGGGQSGGVGQVQIGFPLKEQRDPTPPPPHEQNKTCRRAAGGAGRVALSLFWRGDTNDLFVIAVLLTAHHSYMGGGGHSSCGGRVMVHDSH